MARCAACGLPAHRYGRNEGMDRYDPMACINQLRGELERAGVLGKEQGMAVRQQVKVEVVPDTSALDEARESLVELMDATAELEAVGFFRPVALGAAVGAGLAIGVVELIRALV